MEIATGTSKNPISKRHHFVPEMLQKNFVNEDGKLYFHNKKESDKGIQPATSPVNLFLKTHLYSVVDLRGNKDVSLENEFSVIEGRADSVIQKIISRVRSGQAPRLTVEEKQVWNEFFYLQWRRVPALTNRLFTDSWFEELLNKNLKGFEEKYRKLTDEERAKFNDPMNKIRLKKNFRNVSLRKRSTSVEEVLNNRGLVFALIKRVRKSFIVGSNPVVKFTPPGRTHLSDPAVEMWLPISSDIAVSPFGFRSEERLFDNLTHSDIRTINQSVFDQSDIVASHSKELLLSLARIS